MSKASVFSEPGWLQALTLSERAGSLRRLAADGEIDRELARRRLQRWRSQQPFDSDALFRRRLRDIGLDEERFLLLLGESPAALARRTADDPGWLTALCEAFDNGGRGAAQEDLWTSFNSDQLALLNPILPLIRRARQQLREGIEALGRSSPASPFDPRAAVDMLAAELPAELLPIVSRTIALELHVARLEGRLAGDTSEERFRYFVESLARPATGLELLAEYPVLARQLVTHLEQWVERSVELLERLARDAGEIRRRFAGERDLGPLTAVRGGAGDRHRGGRSVHVLGFESGLRMVYKPRSLGVEARFQELLRWLNEEGDHPPFRTLEVLDRDSYGWVEFVASAPCMEERQIERFYRRLGGLLAVLHLLEATDFHHENMIASGEFPILIDLESLFHPRLTGASTAVADTFLDQSVLRVGLLPRQMRLHEDFEPVDLSAVGSPAGQLSPTRVAYLRGIGSDQMRLERQRFELGDSDNRVRLAGREAIDPRAHVEALLAGFETVYRTLCRRRARLLDPNGPLQAFAECEVRVILRPTLSYVRLLQESFHPTLLSRALDRDLHFDRLWGNVEARPYLIPLIAAEQADLWCGDVPYFHTRPDSRDLWPSEGERLSNFFHTSGLTAVRRRFENLGEGDLARQTWFIRASLATLSVEAHSYQISRDYLRPTAKPADRQRLLAAAVRVGQRLEQLGLFEGEDEVSWVGVDIPDERTWSIVPLGLDLYGGLPGVALFLAHLGAVCGEERFTDLARRALRGALRRLDEDPSSLSRIGACVGWGGMIYCTTLLAALWNDHGLMAETAAQLDRLPPLLEAGQSPDWMSGFAGAIGALLAFRALSGSRRALELARRCGDELLFSAQPMERGLGWSAPGNPGPPLGGFSHGAAGIAWALLKLAAACGEVRYQEAAVEARRYDATLYSSAKGNWVDLRDFSSLRLEREEEDRRRYRSVAWCNGAAGIGLARLDSLELDTDEAVRLDVERALDIVHRRGFGRSHCLCHGDLGNLELLVAAASRLDATRWQPKVERFSAMILDSIDRRGWICGVPMEVETPGLFTGLAGIGYGLLRLAEPRRVPSVLLLEPPQAPKSSGPRPSIW